MTVFAALRRALCAALDVFGGFHHQETLNSALTKKEAEKENDSQFPRQETKKEDAQSSATEHVSRTSQS